MMLDSLRLRFDDHYDLAFNMFLHAEKNHLFNEPAFFQLHATSPRDFYAQLVRRSDQTVFATIACYAVADGIFTTPKRGTFGGMGANHPLTQVVLEQFFLAILTRVRDAGGNVLKVKCPPLSHDLSLGSVVSNILLRHHGTLSGYDLNYDMKVDARGFQERVEYGNAKRIRKCLREGFVVEEIESCRLHEAYQVILANRVRRNIPISMTAGELQTMTKQFPGRLHCFAVYRDIHKSDMIAASVCIAVTASILYVFYWGDVADMQQYSPIALLASGVYEFCQRNDFLLLDAGTATVEGEPNEGLMHFKRNLGFTESLKPSFTLRC
jgi:hypothetical protein